MPVSLFQSSDFIFHFVIDLEEMPIDDYNRQLLPESKSLFFFIFFFHIFFITYIHSITFMQYNYPSPFAGVSVHLLIACKLSGRNLPVVPSRESNSGLPYSKPTRYQRSHAAPYEATPQKYIDG